MAGGGDCPPPHALLACGSGELVLLPEQIGSIDRAPQWPLSCPIALLSARRRVCTAPTATILPALSATPSPSRSVIPHRYWSRSAAWHAQAARLISSEGLSSLRPRRPGPARLAESWTESPTGLAWTIQAATQRRFPRRKPGRLCAVKQSLERSLANADRDLSPGLADIVWIETPSRYEVVHSLRRAFNIPARRPGRRNLKIGSKGGNRSGPAVS